MTVKDQIANMIVEAIREEIAKWEDAHDAEIRQSGQALIRAKMQELECLPLFDEYVTARAAVHAAEKALQEAEEYQHAVAVRLDHALPPELNKNGSNCRYLDRTGSNLLSQLETKYQAELEAIKAKMEGGQRYMELYRWLDRGPYFHDQPVYTYFALVTGKRLLTSAKELAAKLGLQIEFPFAE